MGEVYRARDAVLERPVAIKVLHRNLAGDAGFIERFRREARAAANLNHQNIVAVHDWGSVDGIYYMVMEYVPGLSVREILHAEGSSPRRRRPTCSSRRSRPSSTHTARASCTGM